MSFNRRFSVSSSTLCAASLVLALGCSSTDSTIAAVPDASPGDAATAAETSVADGGSDATDAAPPIDAPLDAPPDTVDSGPPDAVGAFDWAKGFGATGGKTGYDSAYHVDIDAAGNLLVGGTFNGTSITFGATPVQGSGDTAFLAKFDPAGNVLWAQSFAGFLTGVTHDATHIWITINFLNTLTLGTQQLPSAGGLDIAIAELDAQGNVVTAKRFGGTQNDVSSGIALGADGAVVVVGGFYGAPDYGGGPLTNQGNEDIFALKLDGSLDHVWSKAFGGNSALDDVPETLAVDGAGNVVLAGRFGGTVDFGSGNRVSAGGADAFVMCLAAANGAPRWSQTYGGAQDDGVNALALDATGAVYSVGYFQGNVDFGGGALAGGTAGMFALYLDAGGVHRWSHAWTGAYGATIARDPWGSVLVGGSFDGSVDFGAGAIASAGSTDAFVMKLSPAHALSWAKTVGGAGGEGVNGVTSDAAGNVYFGGDFSASISVPTQPNATMLAATSSNDALVVKMSP